MGNMRVTYVLEGDDQTPRAHLEGAKDLINDQIMTRVEEKAACATKGRAAILRGEIDGLEIAYRIIQGILEGLNDAGED